MGNTSISEYTLDKIIYTGANTNIYRSLKEGNVPVILKVLRDDYPTLEAIARLKHEYSIAKNLEHDNIVKVLQLENHAEYHAIVFEDFGGISLKQYLANNRPSLQAVLQIAIAITQALIYIHSKQIIHKDIKPANIIVKDLEGNKTVNSNSNPLIKLTDFSIASLLEKEITQQINCNQLEGTLAYISPEQTGRMNRSLDYRTDFYSLGVTLYQMLTGQLPFTSNDPLELIHAHIAEQPTSINNYYPDINITVCAIVEKLMAKNAEDRYQSPKGLLADLQECWKQLQATGTILNFTPGQLEVVSQLLIPQKLYGRESQVQLLLNSFERMTKGNSQLILVSGYSGIGKTSVINEVNKPITKTGGYFISGKSDQFKRDIPYASLIQAFSSLCRQLLTESSSQLKRWQYKIQKAVGNNGQVIIDLIPEVELIIGKQIEIPQLEPTEAQNRLNQVFQKFVRLFTKKEHPLVIFLDDLQWADTSTLKLMQLLATDFSIEYLLLIGAYRNNEVNPTHPLINTIEEIEKHQNINHITLEPLSNHNVIELVAETLKDNKEDSYSLAKLIFNKTGGNPFFVTQLLQSLHQESLIKFDFNQQKWLWTIQEIQSVGITDKTVVDLVASRIEKLPKTTQEVLKLAACIGDKFTLNVLSIVKEESISRTAAHLNKALEAGLILPLNQNYRIPLLFDDSEKISSFDNNKIGYKFLHDRVQQAAYSLIPDNQKQITHLKIGQLLRKSNSQAKLADNILDIVNQLNFGVELLNKDTEKYELANLNLIAGKKAKRNAAFEAALKYLNIGLKLLVENSWQSHYGLTLGLYLETAETEYLTGNFEKSHELVNISLNKSQNTLDKIRVYEIQIQSYTAKGEITKALDIGVIVLKDLGLNLPKRAKIIHVLSAFVQTKLVLAGKKIENLLYLPEMQEPYKLATMKMLMFITPVASQSGSLLFPLMALAMVRLSVQYGNSIYSSYAYTGYGAMLCDKFGDINAGYRFGQLGIKLLDKMNAYSLKAKVYMIFNTMLKHFKESASNTLPHLIEGMQSGLETGDFIFSSYNSFHLIQHSFICNNSLDIVVKEAIKYIELTGNNSKSKSYHLGLKILKQTILNLQGLSSDRLILLGNDFNEMEITSVLSDNSTMMSNFYCCKTKISYLFGDYQAAISAARQLNKYQESNPAFLMYLVNNFYYSLSLLANYKNQSLRERIKYLNQVLINQKKMKLWAHHAPCNFQHKYDLVEAEKARVLGKNNLAIDLYDKAVAAAKENHYTAEEALANELAAKFYMEQGKEKVARIYMTDACYGYVKWGAFAKVKDLEDNYPNYIIRSQTNISPDTKATVASTSYSQTIALDTSTLIKSSLALSSEVILEDLVQTLMHLAKLNAGAEKVLFVGKNQDELIVEASLNEKNEISILQSLTINAHNILPISIINYAYRTQLPIILDDANSADNFKNDSYIIANKPKSILVSPVIHNGKMSGILYLENNLTNSAFTKDRLEILKVLSAQAAVSIENARFYSTLESRVSERTQQLKEKNQELQAITQQLQTTLQELQRTQSQLIHNEKMSSLGQLVAGIAHEINNPVSFIYGNLTHTHTYIESLLELIDIYQENCCDDNIPQAIEKIEEIDLHYIREDVPNLINSMKIGASRIRDIIKSLRIFSRLDESKIKKIDIHESLDITLMILVQKLGSIQVTKDYGKLPLVYCYAGELNQVFLHLITNAIDALSTGVDESFESKQAPTIRITTEIDAANKVIISISDNGVGMKDNIKQKIFDPFFTTKPVGQGTGMGLSICHQIITEKHRGKLECISSLGEGTKLIICIPCIISS